MSRGAVKITSLVAPLALVALLAPAAIDAQDAASRAPNVLWILADDLGWTDLACQGNEKLRTPHIDRLARDGMRFTDAYAPSPVCSPTRASLLTGLSPARLRITNHIPDREQFTPDGAEWLPAETLDHLPLEHDTLAERLKRRGYATGFFGKWHLSGRTARGDDGAGERSLHPEAQGFDVNAGGCALGGPPTFFDPYGIDKLPPRKAGEYLPDRLADELIAFVEASKRESKPFLACLWSYAVHWPMEAPDALVAKYRGREGPGLKDARYAAMIEAWDASIGRILAALEPIGIARDTLVIFTSDNGAFGGVSDLRPLRDAKGTLYEGGIRVPLIVRWPGVIAAGKVERTPVIGTDLYFTILDACGVDAGDGPRDGESLMPILRGTGAVDRDALFFHYPNYAWHRSNRLGSAIRRGEHKLIAYADGGVELYDLASDISESADLSATKTELARALRTELERWLDEAKAARPRRATPAR